MGYTRPLMCRWWRDEDADALERLLRLRALYSPTRDLGNAAACYGEYLVARALGARRLAQAHPQADCVLPSGRLVEVKTTTHPRRGWPLRYRPLRTDYAVLRFDPADWRVTEAWFVPLRVAQCHATGEHHTLPADGTWHRRARPLELHRF